MDLIHEAGPKQAFVDLSAAFAEQAFDSPLLPEPAASGDKIDLRLSAYFDRIGDGAKPFEPHFGNPFRGQDDDWGKAVAKDFGFGIECARAADHDAQIVFEQAAPEAFAAESRRSRPEVHGGQIDGSRAGHD